MQLALGTSLSSGGPLQSTAALAENLQPRRFFCDAIAHRHCRVSSYRMIKLMSKWPSTSSSSSDHTSSLVRAVPTEQEQYVDYNSPTTVFPAEACEELGGEFCGLEGVGDEVKAAAAKDVEASAKPSGAAGKDLEYLDYNSDKTVFPGEACDELGGKFCEPEYQKGVFPEKAAS